jgi:hypothetical protein
MKLNPFVRPGADWMLSKKGNGPVIKKEPKQCFDTNAPWVTPPWWKNIAVTDVSVGSLGQFAYCAWKFANVCR